MPAAKFSNSVKNQGFAVIAVVLAIVGAAIIIGGAVVANRLGQSRSLEYVGKQPSTEQIDPDIQQIDQKLARLDSYLVKVDEGLNDKPPDLTTLPTPTPGPGTIQSKIQTQIIADLKAKATKEIDRRINTLNALIPLINANRRLTAEQKTSHTSQIQAEIASLNTLKSKIQNDTDLATLKNDIQAVVTEYRTYAFFIPKIYLLAAADTLADAASDLSVIADDLATQIQREKDAGKNVSKLEPILIDMQNKIADAKNQSQKVFDQVTPLTPQGYPDNKTELQNAKNLLATGRQDLKDAREDAVKIRAGLKLLSFIPTPRPTPSASPQPTPVIIDDRCMVPPEIPLPEDCPSPPTPYNN